MRPVSDPRCNHMTAAHSPTGLAEARVGSGQRNRVTVAVADAAVHRYYDPSTGTFLSVDPLVALTGDPYGYVSGGRVLPVSARDGSVALC